MRLRSQPNNSSASQPMSIRELMKTHDLSMKSDERILPPSLTSPQSALPLTPPSHIESQESEEVFGYPGGGIARAPRRKKIFQDFQRSRSPVRGTYSFGERTQQPNHENSLNQNNNLNSHHNNSSFYPQPNQSNSNSHYQTVQSMKKNNSNYDVSFTNVQPSGISLRSRNISNGSLPPPPPSPHLNLPPSILNPLGSHLQSQFQQPSHFQNQFSPQPLLAQNQGSFQPQQPNRQPQTIKYEENRDLPNPYLDLLLQDFEQYKGRQNQPMNNSFNNQNNYGNRPFNDHVIETTLRDNLERSPFQSVPLQQNPISPFEERDREKIKALPQKVESIEQRVNQQSYQIEEMNQKINEAIKKQNENQKELLGQLINKEQKLNLKQREINENIDNINRAHQQNILQKEQLLRYQLELQRANRIQNLSKQNQKLLHDLVRKETRSQSNAFDSKMISYGNTRNQPSFSDRIVSDDQFYSTVLSPFAPDHY